MLPRQLYSSNLYFCVIVRISLTSNINISSLICKEMGTRTSWKTSRVTEDFAGTMAVKTVCTHLCSLLLWHWEMIFVYLLVCWTQFSMAFYFIFDKSIKLYPYGNKRLSCINENESLCKLDLFRFWVMFDNDKPGFWSSTICHKDCWVRQGHTLMFDHCRHYETLKPNSHIFESVLEQFDIQWDNRQILNSLKQDSAKTKTKSLLWQMCMANSQ